MPEQTALPLWPRQHDLPPRWDGLPIEWGGWSSTAPIFICPPPKRPERCPQCSSTRPDLICLGRVWTDPETAPRAIRRGNLNNGRHIVTNLAAFRCPDCRHDRVVDGLGTDAQTWDLDPTDYTDDGSWDVAGGRDAR